MMTDPQAALDILSGIDSAEVGRMDRGGHAFHTLLMTEAEPLIERTGDMELLGLLNTRIAELYQVSLVNSESAIHRYRKAILFQKVCLR